MLSASGASAGSWQTVGATNGHGERLSLSIDATHSYVFECGTDAVSVTETGVTDLLDIRGNRKVGDTAGSVMPEGAAMMALYSGKGDPNLLPAAATPNPTKGWDLTLRLAKSDKALNGIPKAEMLSLFTTGFTAAVPLDSDDHAKFSAFLTRCRS